MDAVLLESRWVGCLGSGDLGSGGLRTLGTVGLSLELVIVRLVGAVDGNLDGDLTTLDLLAVHLIDGLLLHLLAGQGDEAKTTSLASLTTGLQLLDHEARDGAKGDLGRRGLVSLKEFLELWSS